MTCRVGHMILFDAVYLQGAVLGPGEFFEGLALGGKQFVEGTLGKKSTNDETGGWLGGVKVIPVGGQKKT